MGKFSCFLTKEKIKFNHYLNNFGEMKVSKPSYHFISFEIN